MLLKLWINPLKQDWTAVILVLCVSGLLHITAGSGGDCYARPAQDAIRDCDGNLLKMSKWHMIMNIKQPCKAHDYWIKGAGMTRGSQHENIILEIKYEYKSMGKLTQKWKCHFVNMICSNVGFEDLLEYLDRAKTHFNRMFTIRKAKHSKQW